ncbi:MAG: divalent cation transporter [Pseudomonadota bacterium]|nr:divalent cation transporter [Pseudomonadota bacterium]
MLPESLVGALLLSSIAGAAIPVGGIIAAFENFRPGWMEREFRHSVVAFGGGVLLSAVALVLVPEGAVRLPPLAALALFGAGGFVFFLFDRRLHEHGGSGAQLLAMVLDFVPEAMALGAMLVSDAATARLLALLIALQNLPEAFNAYRELKSGYGLSARRLIGFFAALALLGPAAALLGEEVLFAMPRLLGGIMLFAGGGILYLTFADIAPQAKLERHWAPPLGAVAGFMVGLAGELYVT